MAGALVCVSTAACALDTIRLGKAVPNSFAFGAAAPQDVDRIAERLREAGAQRAEGPEFCPEIGPNYYAFFFEDAEGNKFEVVCR